MNGAGAFLVIAGVWMLAQVLWGNALQRVGIFGGISQGAMDQLATKARAALSSDPTMKDPATKAAMREFFQVVAPWALVHRDLAIQRYGDLFAAAG